MVVVEGAATLVLEALEHAARTRRSILGEMIGFGTNCDGAHMTSPDRLGMQAAMELALEDAGLRAADIGYVNAHGTATEQGDIAETQATARVFGRAPSDQLPEGPPGPRAGRLRRRSRPGSCCMRSGTAGSRHAQPRASRPALRRARLRGGAPRRAEVEFVMSNNFAFGGVNTSLILRRWSERS